MLYYYIHIYYVLGKDNKVNTRKIKKQEGSADKLKDSKRPWLKNKLKNTKRGDDRVGRMMIANPLMHGLPNILSIPAHASFLPTVACLFSQRIKTETQEGREKQMLAKAIGNIIKKYWLHRQAQTTLELSQKRVRLHRDCVFQWTKRDRATARQKVASFLRDDVSGMMMGRKETDTRYKKKMQKRLLTDTLKNIHRKLLSENTDQVPYKSFCSLRPF